MVEDPDVYPFASGSLPNNDNCALKLSTDDVFGLPMAVNPQQEAWAAVGSHSPYFQDQFGFISSVGPEIKPATTAVGAVSAEGKGGAPIPPGMAPPGFDEGILIDHHGFDINGINTNPSNVSSECVPAWASDYDNFVTRSLAASDHPAATVPSSSPSFQGFAATNRPAVATTPAGAACLLPTPPTTTTEVIPFDWCDLTTVSSIPQATNASSFAWQHDSPLGDIALPPPLSSSSSNGTIGLNSPDLKQPDDNFTLPSPISLQSSPSDFGSRWRQFDGLQHNHPSLEASRASTDFNISAAEFADEQNHDIFIEPTQTLNDRNSLCVSSNFCAHNEVAQCHHYHHPQELQSPGPLADETGIIPGMAPKQWMYPTHPSASWNEFAPTLTLSPSAASPLELMPADTSMGPTARDCSTSLHSTTDHPKPRITRRKSDMTQKSRGTGNTRVRKTSNTLAISTRSSVSNSIGKLSTAVKRSAPSTSTFSASCSSDAEKSCSSPCGSPSYKKRIGKRKGPLRPDQRRQASEIRKLRACLRCKFLKKTCDKGEPCGGCQPAHARLWQVPCTRIDIKDIGYFMEDWSADYNSHPAVYLSILQGKNSDIAYGFSDDERTLHITHGFGQGFSVKARELFIADESCLHVDWLERDKNDSDRVFGPHLFGRATWRLSVGVEGVSQTCLSEYLDRHIDSDGVFECFVDDFFTQTPFVTEMMKTIHRFYIRTGSKVIRRALKLILAYNLTQNITWLDGLESSESTQGIDPAVNPSFMDSLPSHSARNQKFDPIPGGRMVAPVFVNFAIKRAMAQLWRDLQRQVLEDLSALYSGVYAGDKLKNWPIIFMLAVILLNVWEEMEFDSHYRIADADLVSTFCEDMEGTPVGVIIGLFHAISQKVPAVLDWDTRQYGGLFQGNSSVCDALTEVRSHTERYEGYLRGCREGRQFVPDDFDSLANKFVAKLVIR